MINLKQKPYYALVVLFCLSLIFVGCEEDPGELRIEQNEETIADVDLENEYLNFTQGLDQDQLKALAVEIGKFINEPEVRAEIISYATEESQGEVYIPFAEILAEEAEGGRLNSIVRERLKEALQSIKCENCRTETIEDILKAEYSLYAPYLAEYHSVSEIPLTISWIDETYSIGTTPGIFTGSSSSGRIASDQIISVDDSYAVNQPVAIIAPPDPGIDPIECNDPPCTTPGPGPGPGPGPDPQPGDPGYFVPPADISCSDYPSDDYILRMTIPEFRLRDQLRAFPWGSKLHFWIAVGEYTNGNPQQKPGTAIDQKFMSEWHITRAQIRDKKWLTFPANFVISDWIEEEKDTWVIVAYKKPSYDFSFNGSVKLEKTIKPPKGAEATISRSIGFTIEEGEKTRQYFAVKLDRCAELEFLKSDGGFGKRNGWQIYRNQGFEWYFLPRFRQR